MGLKMVNGEWKYVLESGVDPIHNTKDIFSDANAVLDAGAVKTNVVNDSVKPPAKTDYGDLFSSKNIGSTLQGIGAVTQGIAGVYQTYLTNKYQKDVLGLEKDRVAKEDARIKKAQKAYENVF